MTNKKLFQVAKSAMKNAYAPYSNFKVGVALLCKSGKIYTGVNIENSSYPATICGERVAMSKAISEGEREFLKIAIATSRDIGWPCGICRQFIFEFSNNIKIVVGEDEDHLIETNILELLPKGFKL